MPSSVSAKLKLTSTEKVVGAQRERPEKGVSEKGQKKQGSQSSSVSPELRNDETRPEREGVKGVKLNPPSGQIVTPL